MLISLQKKFIFIANLKSASTSIEEALSPWCEISLKQSEYGKHMSYQRMRSTFAGLFRKHNIKYFFKFCVIREPTDYCKSLYASHKHIKFTEYSNLSTANMSFHDFVNTWRKQNQKQFQPQCRRFKGRFGNYALNFCIDYNNFKEDFNYVIEKLQLSPINLPTLNMSQEQSKKDIAISPADEGLIRRLFKEDYAFIRRNLPSPKSASALK